MATFMFRGDFLQERIIEVKDSNDFEKIKEFK